MQSKTTAYATTLEIDSGTVLEAELDRVVDSAIQHSLADSGHGILIPDAHPDLSS